HTVRARPPPLPGSLTSGGLRGVRRASSETRQRVPIYGEMPLVAVDHSEEELRFHPCLIPVVRPRRRHEYLAGVVFDRAGSRARGRTRDGFRERPAGRTRTRSSPERAAAGRSRRTRVSRPDRSARIAIEASLCSFDVHGLRGSTRPVGVAPAHLAADEGAGTLIEAVSGRTRQVSAAEQERCGGAYGI